MAARRLIAEDTGRDSGRYGRVRVAAGGAGDSGVSAASYATITAKLLLTPQAAHTTPPPADHEIITVKPRCSLSAAATPVSKSLYANFKQGDLVFGLAKSQEIAIENLSRRGFTFTYANSLNNPVMEIALDKRRAPREGLESATSAHLQFLRRHKAYLLRPGGRPIPAVPDPVIGPAYRRACKLLLISRERDRTSIAHVIVAGIDWGRVINKAAYDLGVTNSEMRAAFRDHLRFGRNPHILFYGEDFQLLSELPWARVPAPSLFRYAAAFLKVAKVADEDDSDEKMDGGAGGGFGRLGWS
jgi:hypothetical protein